MTISPERQKRLEKAYDEGLQEHLEKKKRLKQVHKLNLAALADLAKADLAKAKEDFDKAELAKAKAGLALAKAKKRSASPKKRSISCPANKEKIGNKCYVKCKTNQIRDSKTKRCRNKKMPPKKRSASPKKRSASPKKKKRKLPWTPKK